MLRYFTLLAMIAVLLASGLCYGDDDTPPHSAVSIELLLCDVAGELPDREEGDAALVARLRELEKAGKLASVTRIRLSTLSGQVATAQFGQSVAVVQGRNFAGGRGRDGAPFNTTSYRMENVGTLIEVTTRVDGDQVIVQCQVEQSRITPEKRDPGRLGAALGTGDVGELLKTKSELAAMSLDFGPKHPDVVKLTAKVAEIEARVRQRRSELAATDAEADDTDRIPSRDVMTLKSTVKAKSGETVLLGGQQRSAGEGVVHTYALLTATVLDAPPAKGKEVGLLKVIDLRHADARDTASVLASVFADEPVKIAADDRTNSLILQGPQPNLEAIEALVVRLDSE